MCERISREERSVKGEGNNKKLENNECIIVE